MSTLLRFLRWLASKAAIAAVSVVLVLVACGLWIYLRDNVDFDQWRNDVLRTLNGDRSRTQAALADVKANISRLTAERTAEQERTKQEESVIAQLKALESTWDKLIGNPEQQKANAEQLVRMQKLRADSAARVAALQQEIVRAGWTRDGLEIALGNLERKVKSAEAQKSKVMHYLEQAWSRTEKWILTLLALYFLGPSAGKLALFFVLAPVIVRGRPVRLAGSLPAAPEVGESRVSADIALGDGERLWVREKFLQASDEGLGRKTRFLLDWRIPFTCLASGLVELIEMKNRGGSGVGHVTLSNQANPHSELAVVVLPEGASLVLRPSFLAGVITSGGRRLTIRRRWQLFRWQPWVTMQLRFFEFVGPCRLVIAGSRGVRAEVLSARPDNPSPARRTNQDATIGFTPNLDYRPVRAETFWSYYRGMNPLFDDLFAGTGIFLCQQTSADGEAKEARKFWAAVWSGVRRVLGV